MPIGPSGPMQGVSSVSNPQRAKSGMNELSILYYNARSILSKLDNLTAICCASNPDIVCIVESWLSGDISDDEIALSGYSIVRLDRNWHGGGILRSSLSFHVTVSGPFDLEIIFVTIHLSENKSLFWGTFYGQPSSPSSSFDVLFDVLCSLNVTCFSNFILLGDFNVDVMSHSPLCNHLDNILQSFSLSQVVTEPTHIKHNHYGNSSLIDLVLMLAPETLSNCTTVPPLANSDHLGILIDIHCKPHRILRK